MRFFYRLLNRLKRITLRKPTIRGALVFIIIIGILSALATRALFFIEKKNWDNRPGEIHAEWNFVTYLPNITNMWYLPKRIFSVSHLPKYQLKISEKDMRDIERTKPGFRETLPEDKKYYKAQFITDKKIYDVEARLRGSLPVHWMYKEKSWRINFKSGEKFNGMQSINLIIPEQKEFLVEEYGNYLATKLGLVAMDSSFVRVKVNKGSYNVYWMTEQWGEEFLKKHHLSPDENLYSEDVFLPFTPLFANSHYWKKYTFSSNEKKKDFSDLDSLIECLNTCSDKDFFSYAKTFIDIDNFARWQAHTVLLGDDHQDASHNNILYFNSSLQKFQFIPWDANRYKFGGMIDILYNPLVARLLKNPDILHQRNQMLWWYITDEKNITEDIAYYDELYEKTRAAFYKAREKRYSNLFFDDRVKFRRKTIIKQFDYLKELLSAFDQEYKQFGVQKVFVKSYGKDNENFYRISILVRSFSDLALRGVEVENNIQGAKLYYDSNFNGKLDSHDEFLKEFFYDSQKRVSRAGEMSKRIYAQRKLPSGQNEILPITNFEKMIMVVPTEHSFFIATDLPSGTFLKEEFEVVNAITLEKADTDIRYIHKEELHNGVFGKISFDMNLKDARATGTEPRSEREFKLGLSGAGLTKYTSAEMTRFIIDAIKKKDKNSWHAPKFFDTMYWPDEASEEFVYRDIYFDTDDQINFKNLVSYRLRNRWTNKKEYEEYATNPWNSKNFPTRIEIQVKSRRSELGQGFSSVNEAHFEFRIESAPFGPKNPPPPQPWDIEKFIMYAQTGRFNEYVMWPAKSLAQYLSSFTDKKELFFEPNLYIVNTRERFHMNIRSPYGSGPNPEQSFIVTVDSGDVYGREYLDFLQTAKYANYSALPKARGRIYEMEIEFERNVSTVLDQKIEEAKEAGLKNETEKLQLIREAFLQDQLELRDTIRDTLLEKEIIVSEIGESKFLEAHSLVYPREKSL